MFANPLRPNRLARCADIDVEPGFLAPCGKGSLDKNNLDRFEIIEYVRLFDDILVIGCSEAGVRGFLAMLVQAARPPWELELDAVSCDGVIVLYIFVQAQRHGDQCGVTWKAHTKPTA